MKKSLFHSLCAVSLSAGLLPAAALADTVTFTLSNPVQSTTTAGGVLSYAATVAAPTTNSGLEYLNGDSFSLQTGNQALTLDDNPFFAGFPLSLAPGDSYTGVLFDVSVLAGATPGSYAGSFSLIGGATDSSNATLGTASFSSNVTGVTPEPSSFALFGTGLLGMSGIVRRRLARA